MIRLPTPPSLMNAPAPAEAFLARFNSIIQYTINLNQALEIQQIETTRSLFSVGKEIENQATAKGFFFG
tara:strand:+ start:100 stop:306 length:207 start_codon:yes stop_codon:yes gene_type:complete